MKTSIALILAVLAATTVAVAGAAGAGVLGLGGPLDPGQSTFVEVVDTSRLGVVAGMATVEAKSVLGLGTGGEAALPGSGWVVVTAEDQDIPQGAAWEVADAFTFTDPNGGDWEAKELVSGDQVAWAVQVGEPRHDETLGAAYNWVVVVDWDKVPEDQDLGVHFVETLSLA